MTHQILFLKFQVLRIMKKIQPSKLQPPNLQYVSKISIVLGKGKQFWTHDKLEMKLFIQSATSLDSRHEVNKLGNIEGDFHK